MCLRKTLLTGVVLTLLLPLAACTQGMMNPQPGISSPPDGNAVNAQAVKNIGINQTVKGSLATNDSQWWDIQGESSGQTLNIELNGGNFDLCTWLGGNYNCYNTNMISVTAQSSNWIQVRSNWRSSGQYTLSLSTQGGNGGNGINLPDVDNLSTKQLMKFRAMYIFKEYALNVKEQNKRLLPFLQEVKQDYKEVKLGASLITAVACIKCSVLVSLSSSVAIEAGGKLSLNQIDKIQSKVRSSPQLRNLSGDVYGPSQWAEYFLNWLPQKGLLFDLGDVLNNRILSGDIVWMPDRIANYIDRANQEFVDRSLSL